MARVRVSLSPNPETNKNDRRFLELKEKLQKENPDLDWTRLVVDAFLRCYDEGNLLPVTIKDVESLFEKYGSGFAAKTQQYESATAIKTQQAKEPQKKVSKKVLDLMDWD